MRTPLIAGNWKMNTALADAHVLADGVRNQSEHLDHIEIVLCPPTIWLTELAHHIHPGKLPHLKLGAQNLYHEEKGAFTGETSPSMVKEVAEYVILGHSERTHIFREKNHDVNMKVLVALKAGITPILCIGEDEKSVTSATDLLKVLHKLVEDVEESDLEKIVVAYEPVWAIGSGNPATPEYAQEVISTLRTGLTDKTRILYGGSVTEENAQAFLDLSLIHI
jgi:triosephosphate isomerase